VRTRTPRWTGLPGPRDRAVGGCRAGWQSRRHPLIEASGLVRTFGSLRALDGLDLEVREGELPRHGRPERGRQDDVHPRARRLLRQTAGTVRVRARAPGPPDRGRDRVHDPVPALYEDLTVRDNLVFFGRLFGLSVADAKARCAELVELVELGSKKKTPGRSSPRRRSRSSRRPGWHRVGGVEPVVKSVGHLAVAAEGDVQISGSGEGRARGQCGQSTGHGGGGKTVLRRTAIITNLLWGNA